MLRGALGAWAPGRPSVPSGFPGWRPAGGCGHAHAAREATRSPYRLPTDGGRPYPGPPEGQVVTLADAEPLTWAGAGPLTWAWAGPRAGGAGPHQSCSNPRPTRPSSEAAADAEPAAARAPGAPPPTRGHFRDRSRPRGGLYVSVLLRPLASANLGATTLGSRAGTGGLWAVPRTSPGLGGDSWLAVGGSTEEATEAGKGGRTGGRRAAGREPSSRCTCPAGGGELEATRAAGVFGRREGVTRAVEPVTPRRPRGPA